MSSTKPKAFIFDFIGTLTYIKDYSMEKSEKKLYMALREAGFEMTEKDFAETYAQAHEKYRIIRYEQLIEVTNAIWISEALSSLKFKTSPTDSRIETAVNVFFEDYINSCDLRPCAKELLENVRVDFKLGLISNFTFAPVIYAALRKLNIDKYFDAVLVSEAIGWRKPHQNIFLEALRRLDVSGSETVYVGDSPLEDMKGAKTSGMTVVYLPSQFYSLDFLRECGQIPDLIVDDLCDLKMRLPTFVASVQD